MIQTQTCGRCGKELSKSVAGGLCTRCMVRDALEAFEDAPAAAPSPAAELGIDDSSSDFNGRAFGDYELVEEIARGGMGVVYRARQKSLNRLVAIKIILVEQQVDPTLADRLTGEAKAAASLQHPNIVGVHEVGEFGDRHYLTMDYVQGTNLHDLCAKEPLEPTRAARYVKTIAEAIHYAHRQGVLHRDLKPSNVLIDQLDQPRITDFGLAKSLATDARLTLSGQTLGTPQYIPPEQASIHHGQAGPWSDVYSIGGILYHLVTGRPPFVGGQVGDVLQQVLQSEPVAPRVLNPSVPRDLETICIKCLEKDPRSRYPTAAALADELGRYLENKPILSRPASRAEKAWRWCRRRPLVASLWLALIFALATGLGGILWQWHRATVGELAARENAYAGDMILVEQALADGNLSHARVLLDGQRPHAGQLDLRGWEWRYRWQQCQRDPAFERSVLQHSSAVEGVVVSAGGKWLALGASDGMVATLDLASDTPKILQSSAAGSAVVALAPRSGVLAFAECLGRYTRTSQEHGQVKLWDVANEREINAIAYDGKLLALAYSPDERFLIAVSVDKTWTEELVTVWNTEGNLLASRVAAAEVGHGAFEGPLAVASQGDVVAVGDWTGQIHVLELPKLDARKVFPAHEEMVTTLAFSPNGRILASGAGYSDASVRLWNPSTGKAIGSPLAGHHRYVQALAFSPDGNTLASASADQSIRLWELERGQEIGVLRGHVQEVWALAYLPDGKRLVSTSKDGSVWMWDTTKVRAVAPPASVAEGVWQFAFMPDKQSGVVVTTDGSVQLWNLAHFDVRESLPELGTNNWMVAPSPDGRWLAVADRSGQVKIWDVRKRRVSKFLRAAMETTTIWAKFNFLGNQLITAGLDQECRITKWDTSAWTPTGTWQFGETPDTGDFSSSGRYVAGGLVDGNLAILDCRSNRKTIVKAQMGTITGIAFSPDESLLAAGSDQGDLWCFETDHWQPIGPTLHGHRMSINSITVSPDGRRIATTGSSGEEAVLLWDVATRRLVATLIGKGSRFVWVAFSPDGDSIAAVARDSKRLHIWRAPSGTVHD